MWNVEIRKVRNGKSQEFGIFAAKKHKRRIKGRIRERGLVRRFRLIAANHEDIESGILGRKMKFGFSICPASFPLPSQSSGGLSVWLSPFLSFLTSTFKKPTRLRKWSRIP